MGAITLTRRKFLIVAAGLTGVALIRRGTLPLVMAAQEGKRQFEFKTGILKPAKWPDSKPKEGGILAINGMFPGPTIRAKEGEEIAVTLCNNLPQPTTIHWHGMHQNGTWFMDGVERISQAAIQPRDCYTYRFRAYPAGTHWYHSHAGLQYSDGLFGPLIIEENNDPYKNDYDYDRIIMINDWFHIPAEQILANLKRGAYMRMTSEQKGMKMDMGTATDKKGAKMMMDMDSEGMPDVGDVPFESALINGKGRFDSSSEGPLETYEVKAKDRIRFRIINASSTYAFRFAIDEHKLSVIATDGALTRPLDVNNLIIDVGERYDVVVNADRPAANYWIRAKTLEENREDHALAVLRYKGAPQALPQTKATWGASLKLGDLKPYALRKITGPTTNKLLLLTGSMMPYKWMVNGQIFELPKKPLTADRNPPDPPVTQMRLKQGDVVRLVINNQSKMSHPFHLHGHYFHVLGVGAEDAGNYNGQALNERDPIQKDTLSIPRKSWAVVQWEADNPGFWFFHCHIEWHLATGMAILVVEGDPPLPRRGI
ncbi:MAG TPA: multicopper oxidase domain-containing protein [Desulfomonilaceae bacterium]|nr:multicopper oxidase domain-containing protein [Desulfomonilaceae bacterium]